MSEIKIRYKLTSPALMWAVIAVGGLVLWRAVPGGRLFYSGWLGMVILVLGIMDWLYVTLKSINVHRKAPASVDGIDKLITEGTYAVVRHPIYAVDIILFWCGFLFYPAYGMLAATVWATLILIFWANLEERMLEEKFMDDYRRYKQRVPMMVPRLKK